jgi:hypothetical protein
MEVRELIQIVVMFAYVLTYLGLLASLFYVTQKYFQLRRAVIEHLDRLDGKDKDEASTKRV